MYQACDKAFIICAPALHAIPDGVGQLLHGMANAPDQRVLIVSARLAFDPFEQVPFKHLLEPFVDILHLLGRLAANHLCQGGFIGAPALHCLLHGSAVGIQVKRCFLCLKHTQQGLLEIAGGLRLDVLNQIPAEHPLVSLLHLPPLTEVQLANDANELIFGGSKADHCFVQNLGTAVFWSHSLPYHNLLVAKGGLAFDVLKQALTNRLVVLLEDRNTKPLGDGAHQRCKRSFICPKAPHCIVQAAHPQVHLWL
mmetsp:Transcript_24780/g.58830  ORF Transcript_24780/g.58830 Transcript_24780/m.58830 type:complete len:253 (-) Transcript_24780:1234-1992(-)